uniref:Transposase n=1 Tax=Ascaris lumbricoides TaxID=6252 RepID=A0A0M3IEZ4_ASCLU
LKRIFIDAFGDVRLRSARWHTRKATTIETTLRVRLAFFIRMALRLTVPSGELSPCLAFPIVHLNLRLLAAKTKTVIADIWVLANKVVEHNRVLPIGILRSCLHR